jgi:hypothetical protein
LKDRLEPAAELDPKRVEQLIDDVDNSRFAAREAAARELAQLRQQVEPTLHRVLASKSSLEGRRRLEMLLSAPRVVPRTATLRTLRAIQALERIGTTEARQVLQKLGAGAAAAQETQDAQEALDRIASRPAAVP